MRIVIDGRMLYWTGVGRYIQALLEQLQMMDHENTYLVLVRKADWNRWAPESPNFHRIEASIDPYSLAEQMALPGIIQALKPDVVHFTAANTPLLWRGKRVVTIHDLTLLDFDTNRHHGVRASFGQAKRAAFRLVFWNNIRTATHLITDTHYVAKQLVHRFQTDPKRVTPALLAADPQLAKPEPLDRFGDLGQFLFYIGNAYPYKNIGSTIAALAELSLSHPKLKLVIAGKRDTFTVTLEEQARALDVGERVKFVGYVSDGEMVALYRSAAAYVNPSLSEGFGLQGLEAMAQDLPVVSARASCLPEVYAEAAEYFSPEDPKDQAAAIGRVLTDKVLAERLRQAGRKRLKEFSWRRMARQTLEVYEAVGKKR